MHATTVAAMLPASSASSGSIVSMPVTKRILTPPNLSPEDKLARFARITRNQERPNAYGRGYAAGQRAERRKLGTSH